MFEAADHLRSEFADLEVALADPEVHANLSKARRIGRRYAELSPLISALDEHTRLSEDLAAARELAADDQGFAAEASELQERLDLVTDRLTKLLAPRDPNDSADALVEI
ncbi:MAG TPA: PCRF domain-containing protein, partial [Propionibacteriaceae bacterium]|nr:PCRF domain-containing protein [Propionibacteriaceae bacterium]